MSTIGDTLMFPRLPAGATFVADTNFVSATQKMFLILFRNILCPQQMFPSLHAQGNVMSKMFPQQCFLVYPGLNVNRGNDFSCKKCSSLPIIFCSLRLFKLKSEGQQCKQKTSPKSYKTEIKVLANPGLY